MARTGGQGRVVGVMALGLLAATITSCGGGTPAVRSTTTTAATTTTVPKHDLRGTLTNITGAGFGVQGDDPNCTKYNGAPVTITDQSGTVIGTATMGNGHIPGTALFECAYSFDAGPLPADEQFYGIKVGSNPAVQFSLAQVRAHNWSVSITTNG